jgi:peptidyl-prolyl cis-trans isomerase A (cyclophilin A)
MKKYFATTLVTFAFSAAALGGVAFAQTASLPDSPASHAAPQPSGPTVIFDTTMGKISCKLFGNEAPVTVKNFVELAEGAKPWTDPATGKVMKNKPLYDGTIFHRVIPNFMIQGGDPLGVGTGGPGYKFQDEFVQGLGFDVPGRLAMANSGPGTNGSQFFITTVPTPHLNGHHTIFGQCDDAGLAVARAIADVPRNGNDKPNTDVRITHITVEGAGKPAAPARKSAAAKSH